MENILKETQEKKQKSYEELNSIIADLVEEKEIYKEALEEAVVYYTVGEYDSIYDKDWSNERMQKMDREMNVYCLSNGFKIKEYEGTSVLKPRKRYPLSAWECFRAETI